jgi:Tfp pilus assembly protein PilF
VKSAKHLALLSVLCAIGLVGCAASSPRNSNSAPALAQPAIAAKQSQTPAIDPAVTQRYERALRAMKAKRDKQAEKLLLEVTQINPSLAGPYVNLGIIYYRNHRLPEAEQAFRTAISVSPQRADVYNHLGIMLRETGRFAEARDTYQKALQLDPSYAYAHLNLGILCDLYLLDASSALSHYEFYQKLVSTPDSQVAKWIVDLQRRAEGPQKTAVK